MTTKREGRKVLNGMNTLNLRSTCMLRHRVSFLGQRAAAAAAAIQSRIACRHRCVERPGEHRVYYDNNVMRSNHECVICYYSNIRSKENYDVCMEAARYD